MPTALITGASSGIGYELAKLFARDKHDLVLVARNGPKLTEFGQQLNRDFAISVRSVAMDLSLPESPKRLFDELAGASIAIDILVNNAAFGKFGDFADLPLEESLDQIQLNITALTHLTKLFLGPMLARRSGKILNVASTAAFQPGPLMTVYYATKAYVLSFSEGLANELRGTGVSVTCLCPGPTLTSFQQRSGVEKSRLFQQFGPMSAATVALDGYRALMKGKPVKISGAKNWLAAESVRFAPRRVVTAISRWVTEPPD